ncbi:MAG: gliding motility protein GldM [Bacteroidaceae bacterium]|nr:gliding motility protein GldM [Bacteroidaceae bacterium]
MTSQEQNRQNQSQEPQRMSPRQKMINLMYVVLMAMLALNVSSDVLKGFSLVDKSLNVSTQNASLTNAAIYQQFEEQMQANPTKTREWYEKAMYVRAMSDSLYNFADSLKYLIVREADGKDARVDSIRNKEDLEAAAQVMLTTPRATDLLNRIISYRTRIVQMVTDPVQRRIIEGNFSTEVPESERIQGKNWEQYMYENMPVAAAVTLLTKLQSDVRDAEGEVLHTLVSNIDMKDIRVNELNAYVIPSSRTVVQGGMFQAQIIMAAVDTTNRPNIYIGGKLLESSNGNYEMRCGSVGDFTFKGYIETVNGSGEQVRRDFELPYSVVAPSATVSADIMNVLYAGYDNPMSMSIPGVPNSKIQASMTGGTLTPKGDGKFIAKPTNVGGEAVITVSANVEGRTQEMGKFTFRVRKLPDPTAYIAYTDSKGQSDVFRGGKLAKQVLMGTDGIGASIDDGLLNIPFRVLGFETTFYDNMGNAVPYVSQSGQFTEQMKTQMRALGRGKRFYITHVRAIGPDGIERTLSATMEVIIN